MPNPTDPVTLDAEALGKARERFRAWVKELMSDDALWVDSVEHTVRAYLAAARPVPSAVPEDHKWFDPECGAKGCQSLVWKQRYESAVQGRRDFREAYRRERERKQMLSEQELHYLRSIKRTLDDLSEYLRPRDVPPSLPSEVLADNRDWLDCFIDQHERANVASPSLPAEEEDYSGPPMSTPEEITTYFEDLPPAPEPSPDFEEVVDAKETVRQVVFEAWRLLDETEWGEGPRVRKDTWDRLSTSLEKLYKLIPETEEPCQPSHAVTLFWPTPGRMLELEILGDHWRRQRGLIGNKQRKLVDENAAILSRLEQAEQALGELAQAANAFKPPVLHPLEHYQAHPEDWPYILREDRQDKWALADALQQAQTLLTPQPAPGELTC